MSWFFEILTSEPVLLLSFQILVFILDKTDHLDSVNAALSNTFHTPIAIRSLCYAAKANRPHSSSFLPTYFASNSVLDEALTLIKTSFEPFFKDYDLLSTAIIGSNRLLHKTITFFFGAPIVTQDNLPQTILIETANGPVRHFPITLHLPALVLDTSLPKPEFVIIYRAEVFYVRDRSTPTASALSPRDPNVQYLMDSIISFRRAMYSYTDKITTTRTYEIIDSIFNAIVNLCFNLLTIFVISLLISQVAIAILKSKFNFYYKKLQSFFNNDLANHLDFLLVIILFFSFLSLIFFSSMIVNAPSINSLFLATLICFMGINLFLPALYLSVYGSYFLAFLRGDIKVIGTFSLATKDSITLFSFALRFIVQSIRLFLVCCVIFLLQEFVHTELGVNLSSSLLSEGLRSSLRFLFEFIDMLIIVFLQLFAFVAILFWLFSFIFTIKDDTIYEYVFGKKKN